MYLGFVYVDKPKVHERVKPTLILVLHFHPQTPLRRGSNFSRTGEKPRCIRSLFRPDTVETFERYLTVTL